MTGQVDLAGDEAQVEEGYLIDTKDTKLLEVRILQVARLIPDFRHIEDGDIQAVIATHERKTRPGPAQPKTPAEPKAHAIAECISPRVVFRHVAKAQGATLAPYVMVFYPPFFKLDLTGKTKAIIHELNHTKPSKKGCKPHWGFGDSDIDAIYNTYLGGNRTLEVSGTIELARPMELGANTTLRGKKD